MFVIASYYCCCFCMFDFAFCVVCCFSVCFVVALLLPICLRRYCCALFDLFPPVALNKQTNSTLQFPQQQQKRHLEHLVQGEVLVGVGLDMFRLPVCLQADIWIYTIYIYICFLCLFCLLFACVYVPISCI